MTDHTHLWQFLSWLTGYPGTATVYCTQCPETSTAEINSLTVAVVA